MTRQPECALSISRRVAPQAARLSYAACSAVRFNFAQLFFGFFGAFGKAETPL